MSTGSSARLSSAASMAATARTGVAARLGRAPVAFERLHETGEVALLDTAQARLDSGRRPVHPARLFGALTDVGRLVGIGALAAALGPPLGREPHALADPIRRL